MDKIGEFFKYLWHCISGAISSVCGYPPDDYTWKDIGVFGLILFIVVATIWIAVYICNKIPSKH